MAWTARQEGIVKGPKLEIFGSGVFALIRPVWIDDLGTRPKNQKILWYRPEKSPI
jgi:hypothetical protein